MPNMRLNTLFGLFLLAIFASTSFAQSTQPSDLRQQIANGWAPDPKLTPGDPLPNVTTEMVSKPGYAKSVRDVPESEKQKVFAEYGITHHGPGEYEVDHLISLELGGSNDIKNLWPEPYHGAWNAHLKDRLENKLHSMVKDHQIALDEAQKEISTDWITAYKKYVVGEYVDLPAAVVPVESPAAAPTSQPDQPVATVNFVSVSGARPGERASATIQTTAGARCSIAYKEPSGRRSTAAGLRDKTADANGKVTWTWLIGSRANPGTGTITVTCDGSTATTNISIP